MEELDFLPEDKPKHETEIKGITPGTIILIVGVMLVTAVLGVQLFRQNQTQPKAGQKAPDFEVVSFDGQAYSLDSLRGQIIVLNFWGDWCPPCHYEAPDLQAVYEAYADEGVLFLGINHLDIEADALGFIAQYNITYPNAPDIGEKIVNSYNIQAAPETFIIGRDGIMATVFLGPVDYDTLAAALDTILAEDAQ